MDDLIDAMIKGFAVYSGIVAPYLNWCKKVLTGDGYPDTGSVPDGLGFVSFGWEYPIR
jgi:hypothetical protein